MTTPDAANPIPINIAGKFLNDFTNKKAKYTKSEAIVRPNSTNNK